MRSRGDVSIIDLREDDSNIGVDSSIGWVCDVSITDSSEEDSKIGVDYSIGCVCDVSIIGFSDENSSSIGDDSSIAYLYYSARIPSYSFSYWILANLAFRLLKAFVSRMLPYEMFSSSASITFAL